jgi:hypothetical protein
VFHGATEISASLVAKLSFATFYVAVFVLSATNLYATPRHLHKFIEGLCWYHTQFGTATNMCAVHRRIMIITTFIAIISVNSGIMYSVVLLNADLTDASIFRTQMTPLPSSTGSLQLIAVALTGLVCTAMTLILAVTMI